MNWLKGFDVGAGNPGLNWNALRWPVLSVFVVMAVAFSLRLVDLPAWDHPQLQVADEHVLATHDAYLWLSAAEDVRPTATSAMPEFTSFFVSVTGMTPGQAAFWLPALLSGLVGVAAMLWGRLLGGAWAGLVSGLVAASVPGFFFRSRLGYYDSDLFILAMPFFLAWAVAWLLGLIGRQPAEEDAPEAAYPLPHYLLAFGLGVLTRSANLWHAHVLEINKLVFWAGVLLALVLIPRKRWGKALQLLAVFGMASFVTIGMDALSLTLPFVRGVGILLPEILGLPFALAVAVGMYFLMRAAPGGSVATKVGVGGLVCVVFFTTQFTFVSELFSQLFTYLKPILSASGPVDTSGATVSQPLWPSITQSVIEAKSVDWAKVLHRLGPTSWLTVVGCIGYVFVAIRRPVALLLAPFLALGLAGGVLGIRFTMFGGPVVALGLAVPLFWAVRLLPEKLRAMAWIEPATAVLGAVVLLSPLVMQYRDLTITPVLFKPFAEGLVKLGDIAEEDARVWGWWDFGYATQYYAKTMTVTDGGNHAGKAIFPEALALTTDSFRQATQVMKYSADAGYEPYEKWAAMPASEVAGLLERMKTEEVQTEAVPPQYVVIPWEIMNMVGWITFYGSWDVVAGEGVKHSGRRIRNFKFDPRGAVILGNGNRIPVSTVDLLDGGARKNQYFSNNGPHLIINKARGEAVLLDDFTYDSVMVQLLTGDPDSGLVAKYFELVVDESPHVRIYRVR